MNQPDLVVRAAIADWMMMALRGEAVSDFAMSFPEVREAVTVKARADAPKSQPTGVVAAPEQAVSERSVEEGVSNPSARGSAPLTDPCCCPHDDDEHWAGQCQGTVLANGEQEPCMCGWRLK